jgi:Flp pilus assembly protein TadG
MRPSSNLPPNETTTPQPAFGEGKILRRSLNAGRPARDSERGGARLKATLWILALAIFVFVMVKVIPVLVDDFEFQDGVQTIARYATATRQTPEQIRAAILKEAEKDDVPIDAKDIKVQAVSGNVRINVDYSVTVDLTFYQWTLNFHPKIGNDSLT